MWKWRVGYLIPCTLFLFRAECLAEGDGSLLGRWQLDASRIEGKTIRVAAGNQNAEVVGPVVFGKEAPHALNLDGNSKAGHRVSVAESIVQANLPEKALTVEAWVKIEKPLEWGGIAGAFQDNGSYEKGWLLGYRNWQFCFAVATAKAGKLTYLSSERLFEPGFWYQVAGTYDGREMKIYVDGKLAGRSAEQSGEIDYPPKAFFTIGAYHDDNELFTLTGEIQEVSLWNAAKDAGEILKRFQSKKDLFPEINAIPPVVTDWPTYLRDNQRTGITAESLEFPLHLKWVHRSRHAPSPAWPPPARQDFWHKKVNLKARVIYDRAYHLVSVGDRVLFGSSADDKVYCLDAEKGEVLWDFFTEGPVRLAPTVDGERVLFGSDDGHVYCVRLSDGMLLWNCRLGPSGRRIPGNQRVIGAWPVRTGILVEEGVAYFCAGLFPLQGLYQAALNVETGKLLASGKVEVSAQGYLERRAGQLHVATGRDPAGAFVSRLLRRGKGVGKELSRLPQEYPFAFIGAGQARLGGGDGMVAAFSAEDGQKIWSAEVEGKAYSLAVSQGKLLASTDQGNVYCFASGPPDTEPQIINRRRAAEFPYPDPAIRRSYEEAAEWILKNSGITRGYCLVLDCGEGRLAYELARRTDLQVVGVEGDPEKIRSARWNLDRAGLYGRVSIHKLIKEEPLPYTDYLFNLIVSDACVNSDQPARLGEETHRVLRPYGGVAISGLNQEAIHRRGPLPGVGEWSHLYGNPANTSCSGDPLVNGSMVLQWFGRPGPQDMIDRHHRTVTPLWKGGRLFIPGNNRVIAVDAYNGTPLWNIEVPESRRIGAYRDCGYLAAAGDVLYVAAGGRCLGLNPSTGKREFEFPAPADQDGKSREWGYVAVQGEILFGTAMKPGAARRGHSLDAINEGTFWDFRPLVTGEDLFSLRRRTGEVVWTYQPPSGVIIHSTLTMGGGKVFFVESTNPKTRKLPGGRIPPQDLLGKGSRVVALDALTGGLEWAITPDLSAIQHNIYLAWAQGKLALVGSRNSGINKKTDTVFFDIHVFDARQGERTWFTTQNQGTPIGGDHGEQDLHPAIVGDNLYCEPFAYELHTGKPLENWGWVKEKRRGCGTISASSGSLFFRQSNPTLFDLTSNRYEKVTACTRPGCWINMIPAGGLLLIPEASSGCTCNYAVQTSLAFLPAGLVDKSSSNR